MWETSNKYLDDVRIEDLFPKLFEDGALLHHAALGDGELANLLAKLGINEDISMDIEYVCNHSGKKYISSLVRDLLKRNGAVASQDFSLSVGDCKCIESIIYSKFYNKWTKLLETLDYDFDALSPYDMSIEEKTTDELTSSKTETVDSNKANTNTKKETRDHTDNSTRSGTSNTTENDTLEDKKDGNSAHNVFGYNSTEEVQDSTDSYEDNDTSTRTNKTENSTNDTLARTEKHTFDNSENGNETSSRKTLESYTRNNPTSRQLTRKGNIGNTTKQELVAQQREMLQWQFWNVVFDDLDTVLSRGMF